jgi:ATP-dependent helicase HrpB
MIRALERDAPATIDLPSGRTAKLVYSEDGGVSASVKLQELFGLADTPLLGPRRQPVIIKLLAPNGRAVQTPRTCAVSGNARIPRSAKNFAAAIQSTRGPRIPGRQGPRPEPRGVGSNKEGDKQRADTDSSACKPERGA